MLNGLFIFEISRLLSSIIILVDDLESIEDLGYFILFGILTTWFWDCLAELIIDN